MNTEVVPYEQKVGALSPVDVRQQVNLIQHILKEVMKKDEHYGVIPGTGSKPTLLKAGAEKLCLTFRLDPQYEITKEQDGVHQNITSKCTLYHIPSGQRFGSGMGSCSTRESKYAYRQAAIKCPDCGKETVIKGKEEYGGGWVCFKKKGGCGSKWPDGTESIEKQPRGRVPNEDIADQYNTVLKMANKRSLVAAVLNATAASDIFTQDIEDMPQFAAPTGRNLDPNEDITEHMGAGNSAAPTPPGAPPSSLTPAGSSFITQEQVFELGKALADCDDKAEAEFLRIAKLERLDRLPADDFAEAMDWVKRRKAKKAKAA